MKAIGYIRVSTREQGDSGLGLDAQRATIEADAIRRGWPPVCLIIDSGYSGASTDRPGVAQALAMLEAGQADALVVAKLDRLSRSVGDFAGLMDLARRQGWALIALDLGVDTTTPAGEMMANVMASFAQFERRVIAQRTKDALAQAKARGVRLGCPGDVAAGRPQPHRIGTGGGPDDAPDQRWAERGRHRDRPPRDAMVAVDRRGGAQIGGGCPEFRGTSGAVLSGRYATSLLWAM
jgi:DNA invertase Pin-like site-specific DNA recombinase